MTHIHFQKGFTEGRSTRSNQHSQSAILTSECRLAAGYNTYISGVARKTKITRGCGKRLRRAGKPTSHITVSVRLRCRPAFFSDAPSSPTTTSTPDGVQVGSSESAGRHGNGHLFNATVEPGT
ncbi:unnamed protein product [Boreogadus saida]